MPAKIDKHLEQKLMDLCVDLVKYHRMIDEIEYQIKNLALPLGETQVFGLVRITYNNPTTTVRWADAEGHENVTQEIIDQHTAIRKYPSWKDIAAAAGVPIDDLSHDDKAAYVTIKIED